MSSLGEESFEDLIFSQQNLKCPDCFVRAFLRLSESAQLKQLNRSFSSYQTSFLFFFYGS
jgi:hypothetical protein